MELDRRINNARNVMSRSIAHPRGHKLRFTPSGANRFERSRSNLASSLPFSREASFEIERPQSHGASKIVINIATSFMKRDHRRGTEVRGDIYPPFQISRHRELSQETIKCACPIARRGITTSWAETVNLETERYVTWNIHPFHVLLRCI